MDFKFKACKKIAELTQVINILFVQNHEKDILLNELKFCFQEFELEMESKIQTLNQQSPSINEQDRQIIIGELSKRFFIEENRIRNHYESTLNVLKTQMSKNLSDLFKTEKQLSELKIQYDNLLIEKANCEFHFVEKNQLLSKDIEEINEKYVICEQNYQNVLKNKANREIESKIKSDKLNNENIKLNKEILQMKDKNYLLENKCKELEMGVISLTEELSKNKKEFQRTYTAITITQPKPPQQESAINEELRKELLRYKLELKNRDKNFNKLFTKNSFKIAEPFSDKQNISQSQLGNKNGFNVLIGHSQRRKNNTAVKIVSAQYDNRSSLPNIYREE